MGGGTSAAIGTTPYRMALQPSGGEVCIGTTAPQATFHVEGNAYINSTSVYNSPFVVKGPTPFGGDNRYFEIKPNGAVYAREIYVQTTAFPDYVFAHNYSLMPLTDVKKYIDQYKHLPNVPGENEVTANGQNLGKLQVVQMEKIEELFLYVIELNKKLQKLEDENSVLKKSIEQLKK